MNQLKKLLTLTLITVMLGGSLGIAIAANTFSTDGNDRKGKYLYRKNCRTCHDGSSAETLSPNSKTQAQWERAFSRYERFECAEKWNELSNGDLNDVYTYLYGHAYDSPQPATCE